MSILALETFAALGVPVSAHKTEGNFPGHSRGYCSRGTQAPSGKVTVAPREDP